ncbi:uncharacterized protein LOC142358628 isoform X2 [Convolutriloba macropyga]|uniref:uncharacterized protein LOC142358628 isoform X2 n=1 Tax=Convolutriloba macropyga TaxID=536237 RepID=UPI003F51DF58
MEHSNGDVRFHIVMHQKSKAAAAKGTDEVKTDTFCLTMPFPVRFDLLPTLASIESILRRKFEIHTQFKARIYMQNMENKEFECINNEEHWRTSLQVRILASAPPVINLLVSPKHRFQSDPKAPVQFESFNFVTCDKELLELPIAATASATPAIETNLEDGDGYQTTEIVDRPSEAIAISHQREISSRSQVVADEICAEKRPPVVDGLRVDSGIIANNFTAFRARDNVVDLSGPSRMEHVGILNAEPQSDLTADGETHLVPISDGTFNEYNLGQSNVQHSFLTSSDFDFDFNAAFRSFDRVLLNAEQRINSQTVDAVRSSNIAELRTSSAKIVDDVEMQNGELSPVARCIEKSIKKTVFCSESDTTVNEDRSRNEAVPTSNDIGPTYVDNQKRLESTWGEKLKEVRESIGFCHKDLKEYKDSIGNLFKKAADDNRESAKLINTELENNMMIFLREQFDNEKKRLRDLFDSKFDMIRQLLIQEQNSEKSVLFEHLEVLKSAALQISKVLENFPSAAGGLTEQQIEVLCEKVASRSQQHVKNLLGVHTGPPESREVTISGSLTEGEGTCQKRLLVSTPPNAFHSCDINQSTSKKQKFDENGNVVEKFSKNTTENDERNELIVLDLKEQKERAVCRRLFENQDII